MDRTENNALARLMDDEICTVILNNGIQREARWNKGNWCFFRIDTEKPTMIVLENVKEWWPAAVRF